MERTILIVDDEIRFCRSLSEILEAEHLPATYTTDPEDALRIAGARGVDLVFLDIRMPGLGGMELLEGLRAIDSTVPVIMITGYPSVDNVVRSMKLGASHVFAKPPDISELLRVTRTLLDSRAQCRRRSGAPKEVVTRNPAMARILDAVRRIGPTDAPVLITGESGTGKELCANSIFEQSRRKDRPFVKVNSAAIPETLMESELFGHERGAFTDAFQPRKGRFELADGGTIFFDEIGDMTLGNQAKILRVLQEQEFERVGGSEVIRTDIRVLAATSKDLSQLIREGRFRDDLYYRLSVITLDMPALRDRRDDIPLLAAWFIRLFAETYQKPVVGMEPEVESFLERHDWPGNVRELRNCVERAVIFCEGDTIRSEDLPGQYGMVVDGGEPGNYQRALTDLSRGVIRDALAQTRGRKAKAAELLKINRRTLYNRMKRLGME